MKKKKGKKMQNKFIKLTGCLGKTVVVNREEILFVEPYKDIHTEKISGTRITFVEPGWRDEVSRERLYVEEDTDIVWDLMNK